MAVERVVTFRVQVGRLTAYTQEGGGHRLLLGAPADGESIAVTDDELLVICEYALAVKRARPRRKRKGKNAKDANAAKDANGVPAVA